MPMYSDPPNGLADDLAEYRARQARARQPRPLAPAPGANMSVAQQNARKVEQARLRKMAADARGSTRVGRPGALPALPELAVTQAQTNQIANRAINQLTTGANERMRLARERFAGTGAEGALFDEESNAMNDVALASQQARSDAELESARRNSDWMLARRASELQGRQQDLDYDRDQRRLDLEEKDFGLRGELGRGDLRLRERSLESDRGLERERIGLQRELGQGDLGLRRASLEQERDIEGGRLGLQRELGRGDLGLRRASLDQERDIEGGRIGLQRELGRGDLALRGELGRGDLGLRRAGLDQEADIERGRQGLTRRGQDLDYSLGSDGQYLNWLAAQLGAETTRRGQDRDYELGMGQQGLARRGQDIDYNLRGREQSIDWERLLNERAMGEAGLGVTQRGQDIELLARQLSARENRAEQDRAREWDLLIAALGQGGRR